MVCSAPDDVFMTVRCMQKYFAETSTGLALPNIPYEFGVIKSHQAENSAAAAPARRPSGARAEARVTLASFMREEAKPQPAGNGRRKSYVVGSTFLQPAQQAARRPSKAGVSSQYAG